jgi:RNA polymerase sigma factor (sigma-70 family)
MNPPPNRGFVTTRWTLVVAASREATPESREALSQLCELYWPPLYGFARRRGYSIEQAQDLTQSFFARFLEKRDVKTADPQRGRFRSFLLGAFKHFLANEYDREQTRKRGGGHVFIALEVEAAEARYAAEPADTLTPEALFERQWALGVLDRAVATLRGDFVKTGKESTFDHLEGFLRGEKEAGYAEIARALGTTEGAIKVTVHRLRRRFREVLRGQIMATVSDDAEIDDEIRYLLATLAVYPQSLFDPRL